jgi:hypothetical protein
MTKSTNETCCVADQFCTSPANIIPIKRAKAVCFKCGEAVCSQCSSKRKYLNYGNVRLCNNCQVDYDGNDAIVMRRLYKLHE